MRVSDPSTLLGTLEWNYLFWIHLSYGFLQPIAEAMDFSPAAQQLNPALRYKSTNQPHQAPGM